MSPSEQVDKTIADHPDWRGTLLANIRRLVLEADPQAVEESKWRGAPTWSHDGLVCLANIFKDTVKVIFSKGAKLADPNHLFNSEISGNAWRGVTLSEGDRINERAFKAMVRSAVELNTSKKTAPKATGKTRRPAAKTAPASRRSRPK